MADRWEAIVCCKVLCVTRRLWKFCVDFFERFPSAPLLLDSVSPFLYPPKIKKNPIIERDSSTCSQRLLIYFPVRDLSI